LVGFLSISFCIALHRRRISAEGRFETNASRPLVQAWLIVI
jgi:hypothetical protein